MICDGVDTEEDLVLEGGQDIMGALNMIEDDVGGTYGDARDCGDARDYMGTQGTVGMQGNDGDLFKIKGLARLSLVWLGLVWLGLVLVLVSITKLLGDTKTTPFRSCGAVRRSTSTRLARRSQRARSSSQRMPVRTSRTKKARPFFYIRRRISLSPACFIPFLCPCLCNIT